VVDREPLIVLMPSDHHLASREAIHPRELLGEIFIGGSNEASVLHAVTEDYLRRYGLDIKLAHGVDNWRWPCPWIQRGSGSPNLKSTASREISEFSLSA
jgi:LysR substrate binding domain